MEKSKQLMRRKDLTPKVLMKEIFETNSNIRVKASANYCKERTKFFLGYPLYKQSKEVCEEVYNFTPRQDSIEYHIWFNQDRGRNDNDMLHIQVFPQNPFNKQVFIDRFPCKGFQILNFESQDEYEYFVNFLTYFTGIGGDCQDYLDPQTNTIHPTISNPYVFFGKETMRRLEKDFGEDLESKVVDGRQVHEDEIYIDQYKTFGWIGIVKTYKTRKFYQELFGIGKKRG